MFPIGGIVCGAAPDGRGVRWCGVPSLASMTAGLGGMEQRGLAGGRVMMDERMMVALSGIVVASTAARPGKVDVAVQH